ncbi:MAG: hypothetical protein NT040_00805 [Bacteroidetes bacterium]|nr:hypothetical protein [Bacteroidota bacterium]
MNGTDVPGETNASYSYQPVLNDRVACKVTSYESCIAGFVATDYYNFSSGGFSVRCVRDY